ncbi:carnosine N-methyltransferase-like isoform X2 [Limulus polyphemus]|uniref:carnosine N-methyltransferase n=1 Tax=Limulus polyphemus TaxID=6850 RepID=A0ABM1BL39_LIMPO|nr:carnosine N-methyltransferase-like isoform X2 [Limulus polyphemus]
MAEVVCRDLVEEENEDRKHFKRILNAFRCYRINSLQRLYKTSVYFETLPVAHQYVLKSYKQHLDKIRKCIDQNNEVIKLIINDVAHMFENTDHTADVKTSCDANVKFSDMDKVQSLLRQFVREWSIEGEQERKACFKPILDELTYIFPEDQCNPQEIQVLVPGAGLGRLAYEIARHGYTCQGNEFSLFMLFASNYILNKCKGINLHCIHPWIHQSCNHFSSNDQTRPAYFPDVNPSDIPSQVDFSMAAGDFLQVYTEPGTWDCIVTCFFLDTANNIVSYIETIYHILRRGGYWINLGPLLYHYADLPDENSIEPSYEDVKKVILSYNFDILKEQTGLKTPYTQNPRSMMFHEYRSVFFVCKKIES